MESKYGVEVWIQGAGVEFDVNRSDISPTACLHYVKTFYIGQIV